MLKCRVEIQGLTHYVHNSDVSTVGLFPFCINSLGLSVKYWWNKWTGSFLVKAIACCLFGTKASWIILGTCPANKRWCYNVTSSLIGWAHKQNDPRGIMTLINADLWYHTDGLAQDYSNSSALAMELLQSCTKILIPCHNWSHITLIPHLKTLLSCHYRYHMILVWPWNNVCLSLFLFIHQSYHMIQIYHIIWILYHMTVQYWLHIILISWHTEVLCWSHVI